MELSGNILEHWAQLSGNAAKLYVFLLASAKQGCLEVAFKDLVRSSGLSLKTLRSAIKELEGSQGIAVERAVGRYARTRIRILGLNQKPSLVRSFDNFYRPAKRPTPFKASPAGSVKSSGVPNVPPTGSIAAPKSAGEPKAAGLEKNVNRFTGKLSDAPRRTLTFMAFTCDEKDISKGFAAVLLKFGKLVTMPQPGKLCTLVITECLDCQRKLKTMDRNPDLFRWPAGLQKHRDTLRRHERQAGKAARAA